MRTFGDRLQVDIAGEVFLFAQPARHFDKLAHCLVRRTNNARGEEQAFDVVALVEGHGQLHDLVDREAGASDTG